MTWQTVIGLEVHAQLKTQSKLFSSAPTTFGAAPNTQTSFIDAGLPGVLPVLNEQALHLALRFGLAIEGQINDASYFERKNYFYPDLPKGYQISQFKRPIISQGFIDLEDGKRIIIERAHLEEDAGKSLHEMNPYNTGIDLNRAGMPLLEIVTTPCLSSASEAVSYLKILHHWLRFLEISDCNMQEGSFRCDVNVSLRRTANCPLGIRTELKNLNSFRFIEKAIHHEVQRHQDLLERGQPIHQETRLYNPNSDTTEVLRSKENENDYRYFPDPDLLPIQITKTLIEGIKTNMPPLPTALKHRLTTLDNLSIEDIDFLLTTPHHVAYYDEVKHQSHAPAKTIVNWLKGTYTATLHDLALTFEHPPVSSATLACLLDHVTEKKISTHLAKTLFTKVLNSNETLLDLMAASSETNVSSEGLETMVNQLIDHFPKQAAAYRAGKAQLLDFFVGQVMKAVKGEFSPTDVHRVLKKALACSKKVRTL